MDQTSYDLLIWSRQVKARLRQSQGKLMTSSSRDRARSGLGQGEVKAWSGEGQSKVKAR